MAGKLVDGEMLKGDMRMVLTETEIMEVRTKALELNKLLNRLDETPLPFNEHENWERLKKTVQRFCGM